MVKQIKTKEILTIQPIPNPKLELKNKVKKEIEFLRWLGFSEGQIKLRFWDIIYLMRFENHSFEKSVEITSDTYTGSWGDFQILIHQ